MGDDYAHSVDLRMDFEDYMKRLAYHYHIKRDVLNVATAHGVVLAANPKSKDIQLPLETLILPKVGGRKAAEGFLEGLKTQMRAKYGIETLRPETVPEPRARKLVWTEVDDPQKNLIHPEDWQMNLAEQTPPQTDDVRAVREFFNRWYIQQPHIQREVIDTMLKGATTTVADHFGIRATIIENPEQRVKELTSQRI
jgi:hypothetical protein